MVDKIEALLTNKELVDICLERETQISNKSDLSFNIFNLISDKYHRENFHSDIIASLLDRSANHRENDRFLIEFLKLINKIKPLVSFSDFKNTVVTRERGGRIDILIRDEVSKKAIIIENKIKNAGDTYRQLPKYLENTVGRGYDVVAVVYLPLDTNKIPNQSDWTKNEIEEITKKLVIIPTFNGTNKDFLNGWIRQCELVSKNIDALSVIKQYGGVINNISINNMDNKIMNRFHRLVSENYETVIETNRLLAELPRYLAKRVAEKYEVPPQPFTKTWIWNNTVAVIDGYIIDGSTFVIDISCDTEKYTFQFFTRNQSANNIVEDIVQEIGLVNELTLRGSRYVKEFSFPKQEKELYDYIDSFAQKLQNKLH